MQTGASAREATYPVSKLDDSTNFASFGNCARLLCGGRLPLRLFPAISRLDRFANDVHGGSVPASTLVTCWEAGSDQHVNHAIAAEPHEAPCWLKTRPVISSAGGCVVRTCQVVEKQRQSGEAWESSAGGAPGRWQAPTDAIRAKIEARQLGQPAPAGRQSACRQLSAPAKKARHLKPHSVLEGNQGNSIQLCTMSSMQQQSPLKASMVL